jgi:hypothetical protein
VPPFDLNQNPWRVQMPEKIISESESTIRELSLTELEAIAGSIKVPLWCRLFCGNPYAPGMWAALVATGAAVDAAGK